MKKAVKVLFVAEAVTLAHVARPAVLAASLDTEHYEVHFAHCPRYRPLLGAVAFRQHEISSVTNQHFVAALASGKPLYDLATLNSYVEQDLQLITEVQPDIVVGDMRLSLSVSARLMNVPYITITNAYWSPYAVQRYTVPDLPLTRVLGPVPGQWIFSLARPIAFALHSVPMHRLRRRYGLKTLGFNLREVYTSADYTLYADTPGGYHMRDLPENHRFIGPILWSPSVPLPPWWGDIPDDRPIIYLSLGSSGRADLLPEIIAALGRMNVTVLVSSLGAEIDMVLPENVRVASFLPGDDAVKRATLVICNGGSPTTHQALAGGKPVIGVAGNLDQYLNMQSLVAQGAGICLRSDQARSGAVAAAVQRMLTDSTYAQASQQMAATFASLDSRSAFKEVLKGAI